jgi:hypothetical protein
MNIYYVLREVSPSRSATWGLYSLTMKCELEGAYPAADLVPDCWHHVLEHLPPRALARAATINQACRLVCNDSRLWRPHFKRGWTPGLCVNPNRHGSSTRPSIICAIATPAWYNVDLTSCCYSSRRSYRSAEVCMLPCQSVIPT